MTRHEFPVPHVRCRRCPAGASVQSASARPLRAVADRSRDGAPALCRRARISSHRHGRARRQSGGGVHLAWDRSPFARRHSCIDRRGRPQSALRERRGREPDLVPGRHARGGRQCPRVFRAAPGDHQPARPRFSRQQLGALRARSGRTPRRVLLRHGADRLGSPEQAGGCLSARGPQRHRASPARRTDGDHELRAQRHRPQLRVPSHRGPALRLLRGRRDVAATVQGHQDRPGQAVRL